jgi:hypothetical protein
MYAADSADDCIFCRGVLSDVTEAIVLWSHSSAAELSASSWPSSPPSPRGELTTIPVVTPPGIMVMVAAMLRSPTVEFVLDLLDRDDGGIWIDWRVSASLPYVLRAFSPESGPDFRFTSTDILAMRHGRPRAAAAAQELLEVRTQRTWAPRAPRDSPRRLLHLLLASRDVAAIQLATPLLRAVWTQPLDRVARSSFVDDMVATTCCTGDLRACVAAAIAMGPAFMPPFQGPHVSCLGHPGAGFVEWPCDEGLFTHSLWKALMEVNTQSEQHRPEALHFSVMDKHHGRKSERDARAPIGDANSIIATHSDVRTQARHLAALCAAQENNALLEWWISTRQADRAAVVVAISMATSPRLQFSYSDLHWAVQQKELQDRIASHGCYTEQPLGQALSQRQLMIPGALESPLLPLFTSDGSPMLVSAGTLADPMPQLGLAPHVVLRRLHRAPSRGTPATTSRSTFVARWEEFTGGLLDGWDWQCTVAVGGAVAYCLAPAVDDVLPPRPPDVDLFFVGGRDVVAAWCGRLERFARRRVGAGYYAVVLSSTAMSLVSRTLACRAFKSPSGSGCASRTCCRPPTWIAAASATSAMGTSSRRAAVHWRGYTGSTRPLRRRTTFASRLKANCAFLSTPSDTASRCTIGVDTASTSSTRTWLPRGSAGTSPSRSRKASRGWCWLTPERSRYTSARIYCASRRSARSTTWCKRSRRDPRWCYTTATARALSSWSTKPHTHWTTATRWSRSSTPH